MSISVENSSYGENRALSDTVIFLFPKINGPHSSRKDVVIMACITQNSPIGPEFQYENISGATPVDPFPTNDDKPGTPVTRATAISIILCVYSSRGP